VPDLKLAGGNLSSELIIVKSRLSGRLSCGFSHVVNLAYWKYNN